MRSPKCAGPATAEAVIEARDSEQLRGRLGNLVAPAKAPLQDRVHKVGSDADAAARDSAVVCSIALQHHTPVSPLGVALDMLGCRHDRR